MHMKKKTVSEFETKVLRMIKKERCISGDGMIAYTAAARRLEKKGLAIKCRSWHVTSAGEDHLASVEQ